VSKHNDNMSLERGPDLQFSETSFHTLSHNCFL
jgi:hypothetical protein